MRITVTKSEIRLAREAFQRNPFSPCPVALAIGSALGVPVSVGSHVYVGDPSIDPYPLAYPLPPEAAAWMPRFDDDENVKPFSFEFPWPQQPLQTR